MLFNAFKRINDDRSLQVQRSQLIRVLKEFKKPLLIVTIGLLSTVRIYSTQIGYRGFLASENGLIIRVDPSRIFRQVDPVSWVFYSGFR